MASNFDDYTYEGSFVVDGGVENSDTDLYNFILQVIETDNMLGSLTQVLIELPKSPTSSSMNMFTRVKYNGTWSSWKTIMSDESVIALIKDNAHLDPVLINEISKIKERLDKLEGIDNGDGGIDLGQLTTTLYSFGVSSGLGLTLDKNLVSGLVKHGYMISLQASLDVQFNTTIPKNVPIIVLDSRCKPDQRFGAKAAVMDSPDRNSKLRDINIDVDNTGRLYFAEDTRLNKGEVVEFNIVFNKMSDVLPRVMELETN